MKRRLSKETSVDKPKIDPTGVRRNPDAPRSNSMLAYLEPGEYLLFADSRTIDLSRLRQTRLPAGVSIEIVPLVLAPGQSLAEAIAIEKLSRLEKVQKKEWDAAVGIDA
jgi:hypothetical protein